MPGGSEEWEMQGNTLQIFKSFTDYIECTYTKDRNLEVLVGDPIDSHMYECFVTEVDELGANLADPRTYKEAMKILNAKQWGDVVYLNDLVVAGTT